MQDEMLTGQVAEVFGVVPGTVRLWERLGLLRARRRIGNVRIFDRRDVERFRTEREAKRAASVTRDGQ